MTWILNYPGLVLCYVFLYLSVILLWFPGKRKLPNWSLSMLLAVLFGLGSRQLEWGGLVAIALFAMGAYYSQVKKISDGKRLAATSLVLFLSLGLAGHQMPGFNNFMVLDHVYLTSDALPYTLFLNFDKAVIGILILGLGPALMRSREELLLLVKQYWQSALSIILGVLIVALILGFVRFEPKLPMHLFIWLPTTLLFTCVAEEALFRGFIQRKLAQQLKKAKVEAYWSLLLASFLFGLANYSGGKKYVLLATLAGLGYGWIYQRTQRIEASILTHFGFNCAHFFLFTYPALASSLYA
jgi:membrane protease YdiL (CAAX protease family)